MSEENKEPAISFRADKQASMLNLKKNQFGHTLSKNTTDDEALESVNLQFGSSGTGIVAHVDIFDSPHLKKFLESSDLDLMDDNIDDVQMDEIDLSEESDNIIFPARPTTLAEFDMIADSIIRPEPSKQRFAKKEDNSSKVCNNCKTEIKKNSKFCSNCGSSQNASFCKNCGYKFTAQENFCSECGTKRE